MTVFEDIAKLLGGNVEYTYPTGRKGLAQFSPAIQPPIAQALPAMAEAAPQNQMPESQVPAPYNMLERAFLGFGGQGEAVKKDKERYQLAKLAESIPADPNDVVGNALRNFAMQSPEGAKPYVDYTIAQQKAKNPDWEVKEINGQLVRFNPNSPNAKAEVIFGDRKSPPPNTSGLPAGQMWSTDAQGNPIAVPVPGAITEDIKSTEAKNVAKKEFDDVLIEMGSLYDELKKEGGVVDTEARGTFGLLGNIGARIANTEGLQLPFTETTIIPGGQTLGRAFGTKEQSLRNKIKQKVPVLLSKIKKATGMTGTELNSNVELQFWLQSLGDIKNDYQSNMDILKSLSSQFGAGGLAEELPATVSREQKIKRLEELRALKARGASGI